LTVEYSVGSSCCPLVDQLGEPDADGRCQLESGKPPPPMLALYLDDRELAGGKAGAGQVDTMFVPFASARAAIDVTFADGRLKALLPTVRN